MRFVRTILLIAIAFSLAILPLGASAVGFATTSDDMQMSMRMGGGADVSLDDCCPDDTKGPISHTGGCKSGVGFCCIGGSVALADVPVTTAEVFAATASKFAIPADQVVSFRGGSPPFRPPRI